LPRRKSKHSGKRPDPAARAVGLSPEKDDGSAARDDDDRADMRNGEARVFMLSRVFGGRLGPRAAS